MVGGLARGEIGGWGTGDMLARDVREDNSDRTKV